MKARGREVTLCEWGIRNDFLEHGAAPCISSEEKFRLHTPIWVSGTVRVGVPVGGPVSSKAPTHGPPVTGTAMRDTQIANAIVSGSENRDANPGRRIYCGAAHYSSNE